MKIKTLTTVGLLSVACLTFATETAETTKEYLTKKNIAKKETYWRIQENKGVEGKPISIGGKVYEKGLGVHAPSKLTFTVDPKFKSFRFIAGPDDAHHGQLEMKVLADDKEVFATGNVRSGEFKDKAKETVIDLTGVKEITLVVTEGEDGTNGGDHASWAEAYFSTEAVPAK